TYDVQQIIETDEDGSILKTINLTYKNPEEHDGWLNSVLPNWVRVYVPKGSELVDSTGLENMPDTYEEFNKNVFAGFFSLRPLGVSKVSLTYKLPFKAGKEYSMFIQ